MSDPEPDEVPIVLDRKGTIAAMDARRPVAAEGFQLQGRMLGIGLEETENSDPRYRHGVR